MQPANEEAIHRLVSNYNLLGSLLKRDLDNKDMVEYLTGRVLPVLEQVPEKSRLPLLKTLADSCRRVTVETAKVALPRVYDVLRVSGHPFVYVVPNSPALLTDFASYCRSL